MPQIQLPVFPAGTTHINAQIAFDCHEGKVTYLNGHLPVFQHGQDDVAAFRLFTAQLAVNGTASQAEIARAFHVPARTVKRYVKRYREGGAKSFFTAPRRRSGSVVRGEAKEQAQALLDEGYSVPEVAKRTAILANTLHKAIRSKRLHQPKKRV